MNITETVRNNLRVFRRKRNFTLKDVERMLAEKGMICSVPQIRHYEVKSKNYDLEMLETLTAMYNIGTGKIQAVFETYPDDLPREAAIERAINEAKKESEVTNG